jgi:hypothetical protein
MNNKKGKANKIIFAIEILFKYLLINKAGIKIRRDECIKIDINNK